MAGEHAQDLIASGLDNSDDADAAAAEEAYSAGGFFTEACRYCGSYGFCWKMTPRGWRLLDRAGKTHLCRTATPVSPEKTP